MSAAGELRWPSAAAASNPLPAAATAAALRPAAENSKSSGKYPHKFHYSISHEMAASLQRLTSGPAGLLREVDIGRLALHHYLLANDPNYARAIGMKGNGNAA